VIEAQHDYGVALLGMGELKPAAVHVAQSLADARSLYGTSSILAGHFGVRLGQIHILQGELEQGVREVRDAVELLAKIDPGQSIASAGRLRTLGLGLLWLHRPQDALPVLHNVIAILEERKDERATLIARADYAMALLESGRHREAGELLASVDEAGSALQPQERPLRALARRELLRGNAAAAKALLLPALEAAERDPRRFFLPDTLIDLGRAQFELGEFDAAAARAQAALQELDRRAVAVTPNHAAAWSVLGRSRLKNGSAAEALDLLERSDHAWLSLAPQSHWTGENAYWLARAYRALGREREAVRTASRAARLLGESPHPAGARLVAQMRTR
jgi:tetratricopeptide (TPR) repeat protein